MKQKRVLSLLLIALLLFLLPQGALALSNPVVGKTYEETVFSAADAECLSVTTQGTVPPGIAVSVSGTGLGNKVILSGTPTTEGTFDFVVTTALASGANRTDNVSLTVLPCASEVGVSVSVTPSASVALGSTITFTSTVTGANGVLSYKWIRADVAGTGQLVGTAASLTYMPASVVTNATMHLEVTNTLNGTTSVKTVATTFSVTGAASPTPTSTPAASTPTLTPTPTVTPTPAGTATPQISESPISGDKEGRIYNCRESVNVRSGPGTGYAVIGTAKLDKTFPALAKSGQWYKIQYTASQTGYVHGSYFTLDPLPAVTATSTPASSISPTPIASPTAEPVLSASPTQTVPPATTPPSAPTADATAVPAVNPGAMTKGDAALYIMVGALGMLVIVAFVTLIVLLVKQQRLRHEEESDESTDPDDDPYNGDDDNDADADDDDEDDDDEDDDEDDLPDLGFRR